MLYLSRQVGETVLIDKDIKITVVGIQGKTVKLGFTYPSTTSILRKELFDKIEAENKAALDSLALLKEQKSHD